MDETKTRQEKKIKTSTKLKKKLKVSTKDVITTTSCEGTSQNDNQNNAISPKKTELVETSPENGSESVSVSPEEHLDGDLVKSNVEIHKKVQKKNKRSKSEKISMKSSFNKFDALQKQSSSQTKDNEDDASNCRVCAKPVYRMEEIRVRNVKYHKTCFRCEECRKQLHVDNFNSHEGAIYCLIHFKSLFAPKHVDSVEPDPPRKAELIIRENQPVELPPDVVRASDKSSLGLEELQKLDVRSRFQIFENPPVNDAKDSSSRSNIPPIERSASILSKLSKLEARVNKTYTIDVNSSDDDMDDMQKILESNTQREKPIGLMEQDMSDIKKKFESGHFLTKEERREDRKQEIQNIRNRLFMGKQARIKEMYQQAVAESNQTTGSAAKIMEVERNGAASSLKELFESGEIYRTSVDADSADPGRASKPIDDADVFESGISKQSRSIFLELDATSSVAKNKESARKDGKALEKAKIKKPLDKIEATDVIKFDEKAEDVEIKTAELSEKFKFFEAYKPKEFTKKQFRITPPREGVVMLPDENSDPENNNKYSIDEDPNLLAKSGTTSKMLSRFREIEQNKNCVANKGPRPLKSFTPPPEDERRFRQEQESDLSDSLTEESDEDENNLMQISCQRSLDHTLEEARNAARAKQLRAKFEKWEAEQIEQEDRKEAAHAYTHDTDTLESTKIIRERFENLKDTCEPKSISPRYKVNRFV